MGRLGRADRRDHRARRGALSDEAGGIINDPVLLRVEEERFWLALADSDALLWAKGIAWGSGLDVEVGEPDVSPVQVQGPRSKDVLAALLGPEILELPYYRAPRPCSTACPS